MSDVQDAMAYREWVKMKQWRPSNCVWELTLACNLKCLHCGSRAGKRRDDELDTEAALDVARQLAELGCERVTLSGGEPTMRDDWDRIGAEFTRHGVYCNLITNGAYEATRAIEIARRAKAAGMGNLGVSLDGTEPTHDRLRGAGSFAQAVSTISTFMAEGMRVAVLSSVSQPNLRELDALHDLLEGLGISIWRLQLTVPMGVMSEHRELVLRPEQILELMPRLASIQKRSKMHVMLSDSVGYYGPHDKTLRGTRGSRGKTCWMGCQAGLRVLGIEADGDVKGCLSLQAELDRSLVEGNLHHERLADIWYKPGAFAYNRELELSQLSGFCADCRYAALCRGGSRCTSAATLGVLTEDTYCYYAQEQLRARRLPRQPAAVAAAAALLVATAPLGCEDSQPKYGVPDDLGNLEQNEQQDDPDLQPPYSLPDDADINEKYGVPDDIQPPYSVPDDLADADINEKYGVPDDAIEPPYSVPVDEEVPDSEARYGLPADVD